MKRKKTDPSDDSKYRALRAKSKNLIKTTYGEYLAWTEGNFAENPQAFWNYIKQKKESRTPSETKKHNDSLYSSPKEIAETFAQYFSSVYDHSVFDGTSSTVTSANGRVVSLRRVMKSQVTQALKNLKPKRSLGPDEIPAYIYKACKEYLVSPLTHVINLCIGYNTYPEMWKLTKITPVPENENHDKIKNHNPVALQPVPAKIFESVVHQQLFEQIKHYITPYQHGFFASRSVLTNLVNFTEAVRTEFDKGLQVDAVYTDFEKAFDKVNHGLLLQKMGAMGFSERLIQLFSSYLKNRQQYVVYKG